MKTSEDTAAISKALAAAQGAMKVAALDGTNPHFKNRYSTLLAVGEACIPALATNGIAVTQATAFDEHGFRLITRLSHESGQWIEGAYPLAVNANPQAMGSQMTYARRYALASIAGVFAGDDDDGEDATKHGKDAPVIPPKAREPNITEADLNRLQTAVVDTGVDLPKFLKYLGVSKLSELPQSRLADAMVALENRRGRAA